jgi:hypothetical protein
MPRLARRLDRNFLYGGPRNSEAVLETSANPLVVGAPFFPSVIVRGEHRTAVVDLEGEAGGHFRRVEVVARVEGVAKTVCDDVHSSRCRSRCRARNRKIAAGRSRLEPLADPRTAPERE